MIVKKKKVITWDLDQISNDGYFATGSFPLSLSKNKEFNKLKELQKQFLFVWENDLKVGVICRVREKQEGEGRSVTKNSKYKKIYYNVKPLGDEIGVEEYVGFSTFYSKYLKLIEGGRGKLRIKKGVKLEVYSTNKKKIFLIKILDSPKNEWREYRPKVLSYQQIGQEEDKKIKKLNSKSIDYLRKRLKKKPLKRITSLVERYNRDPIVVAIALKRAKGYCELCKKVAPFKKNDGTDYLEVHHINPLSKGGEDKENNVLALCPNCHRKLHYGKDKDKLVNNIKLNLIQFL